MEMTTLLLAGLAVVAGALVQGTTGLGLSLVTAPVVALLDPSLLPGAMLVLGTAMPSMTLAHEWRHVDWHQAGWLLGARIVTTPLGVLVLIWLPTAAVGAVIGGLVLVTVCASVWRFELRPTRPNLLIAGAVAGVSATAASIGGPPAAIVLQHERGPRLRATLAAFFLVGAVVSLAALGIGGELTRHQLLYGATWIPALVLGFGLAVPLQRQLQGPRLRQAVLLLAAVSSVAVILRAVATTV